MTQIAHQPLLASRKALGWTTDDVPGVRTIVCPTAVEIGDLVRHAPDDAVHIFSGIRWVPTIVAGLGEVLKRGGRFGLMQEPRVWTGLSGFARRVQSLATEGRIRRHVEFVLGIGRHGPTWFNLAGYNGQKVHPFAYFLAFPPPAATNGPQATSVSGVRKVGYLGRLTAKKGFGVFTEAIGLVRQPIEVRIAGTGEMEAAARELAAGTGPASVSFLGPLPMSEVNDFLAGLDILVVPSLTLDDGWAAVVCEALAAGAAVIASNKVGASICLTEPRNGLVLKSTDPRAVAGAIDEVCASSILDSELRSWRMHWVRDHVSAEAGARYLIRILRSVDGVAPRPEPYYADAMTL
ncbi:glycosyltransferase [Prosthecodimorpha hirschii]|uniref:glycosyltransferase n=1 Tax=Prosthecodimorpha hirschii TaxID=665126 RepID=UPI0015E4121F|nr:glycosyltransferase [Prosthecomicrobium hirschii]